MRNRRVFLAASLISACSVAPSPVSAEEAPARAVVLGIAQDGGVPHIGCTQELCAAARRDPSRRQRVASLGLVDARSGQRFMVDATPDFVSQLESLNEGRAHVDRRRPLDGILLTHAHVGHYTGLMYLGREALGARGVPVLATPRMARFLRENGPWSQLVSLGNIELRELEPGAEIALTPALRVTAVRVPHRDEFSDTVGYVVRGPTASLLYIPDIDQWDKWDRRVEDELGRVDHALLDATFHSVDELPGRAASEVPHPLVTQSMRRLSAFGRRVRFIHLNHTNRLLFDPAAVAETEAAGFRIARDGDVLPLETAR